MDKRFANFTRGSARQLLAWMGSLVIALPLFAGGRPPANTPEHNHGSSEAAAPAKLVQLVREGTKKYIDVNVATAAGYGPFLGCISGSDHGAMGIHYVNGALLNGTLDPANPQALIYEPSHGKMQLVGVEFIVDAQTWLSAHGAPPVLENQTFLLVGYPNRYGINSFFELHVWAWRDNPQGAFVDWNNDVTCENQ